MCNYLGMQLKSSLIKLNQGLSDPVADVAAGYEHLLYLSSTNIMLLGLLKTLS